ncbi:MAG: 6-phosphofructokinase [Gemmataceae bacterium]|nr:6-phosphofructokinase [Gemmataceae bacterium]MCI0741273.1 6-phosphofructokinase [Gemmataceae bacterium]
MGAAKAKCIGILTSGGDCPGLNAAIRGVAKPALSDFHVEVIGIEKGFRGLVENNSRILHQHDVSGILSLGGTILGTSREKPYKMPLPNGETVDLTSRAVETYSRLGLDCLVVLGGNGTHKVAYTLVKHGLNVIGLPKTIDNDLVETDITFGHDSAVNTAAQALDKLYSTAEAHLRVMVVEVMGHDAGWLALNAGLAGGADIILIPEIPYDMDSICKHLTERRRRGKWFSIVAVAEGARPKAKEPLPNQQPESDKDRKKRKKADKKELKKDKKDKRRDNGGNGEFADGRASSQVAKLISERLGMETRVTVLGHLQRGGIPTPFDRILATRFGTYAAEMLAEGVYNHMVCLKGSDVNHVPLEQVAGKIKLVPRDHALIRAARRVGTNFGD